MRNAIICFDDLERGGSGLRVADVFGLASFLKEERNCKVVLISNQERLSSDGKDDLSRYLEKVVDETVHFAPTVSEACRIALGEKPDVARSLLRERINALGISNIRVISRLSDLVGELSALLEGLHERVLQEAVQTLALFGAAHFLATDGFPSVEYLMKLGNDPEGDFRRGFKRDPEAERETDEGRRLAGWEALLRRYGYGETNPFDAQIGIAVQVGYFDCAALAPLARELSDRFQAHATLSELHDAWQNFFHSLNGNGEQLLHELRELTLDAIDVIGLDDLYTAYDVFMQVGDHGTATQLLEAFIARNQHRPAIFDQVDGPFRQNYMGDFADRLRAESDKHTARRSIEEALDNIDFERGWNPDDLRIVGTADTIEIERLLRGAEGRKFRIRLKTLLQMGTLGDADENAKRVSDVTRDLLVRLARDDPIIAIRMQHYISPDGRQNL